MLSQQPNKPFFQSAAAAAIVTAHTSQSGLPSFGAAPSIGVPGGLTLNKMADARHELGTRSSAIGEKSVAAMYFVVASMSLSSFMFYCLFKILHRPT